MPADCRILESSDGFMVDNSAITGESEPIELDPTATHEKQLFSRNMAFFSATVVRGRAKAVVTRTVHSVEIYEFSVKLIKANLDAHKWLFWQFPRLNFHFGKFLYFHIDEIYQKSKFGASEIAKMPVFKLLKSPKMISRKI